MMFFLRCIGYGSLIIFFSTFLNCKGDSTRCEKNSDCSAGYVCKSGTCWQLCNADKECAHDRVCQDQICIKGDRTGRPRIDDIQSNGINACFDRDGLPTNCLGTMITVLGNNLANANFTLKNTATDLTYNTMTDCGGSVSDTQVDLVPVLPENETLVAGPYVLVAVNQNGTTEQCVELLQGVPGPKGPTGSCENLTGEIIIDLINGASSGSIDSSRLPNDVGSSSQRHVYNNSTQATSSEMNHDRMIIQVNGSSSVQSQAIDDTKFKALCADVDGCAISIGYTKWANVVTPLMHPPCRFFLDSNRNWSTPPYCVAIKFAYCTQEPCETNPNVYTFYTATASKGDDGDNTSSIIMHNQACYFTEAAADTSGGQEALTNDDSDQFYLIASHPNWGGTNYDSSWPETDNSRTCIMIVED